jgi:pimeloyl-ACP methyl ester carboxylesterase
MLQLLDSGVDTPPEALAMIGMPVLVVAGTEDDDNGSAEALAAALPRGQAAPVPGNHITAVARPELGTVIAGFLDERAEEDATSTGTAGG